MSRHIGGECHAGMVVVTLKFGHVKIQRRLADLARGKLRNLLQFVHIAAQGFTARFKDGFYIFQYAGVPFDLHQTEQGGGTLIVQVPFV